MNESQLNGAGLLFLSAFAALTIAGFSWSALLPGDERPGEAAVESIAIGGTETAATRQIFVQPGWRLEQIARAFDETGADGQKFLELTKSPWALARIESYWALAGIETYGVAPTSLEGYIPPGLYEMPGDFGEDEIVGMMLDRFDEEFAPILLLRSATLGLSSHEVVTLASIVERETVRYADAPVIAGVYFNRLIQGSPLQADPTVAYAVDSTELSDGDADSYWERELRGGDLALPSEYNTYLHKGLPPGPIGSPSLEAISAVLFPARSDYLHFVTLDGGSHAFSRTIEEHMSNLEQHPASQGTLQRLIEKIMEPVDGHVGVVVRHLDTGESAVINADDLFTSASLYKLTVMAALFDLQDRAQISFDEELAVPADAWQRDRQEARDRLGDNPTIAEAVEQMIVISSNAAGETLLDRVGREQVEEFARASGMNDTWLTTKRLLSTPGDMARLLEMVARRDLAGDDAAAEMSEILLRQEINDRLPANLPDGVAIAHKTGSLDYASHDAGILFTSRGPVVIAVMTEDVTNRSVTTAAITKLGELVHEYFEHYIPAAERLAASHDTGCVVDPGSPSAFGQLAGRTIVLDPGHGGDEAGTAYEFADGSVLNEQGVTLDIALRLRDLLVEEGTKVDMTRCADVSLGLMERAALSNSTKADLFISIHLNGSEDSNRDGTEVYYFSAADQVLANYLSGTFTVPALWNTLSSGSPLPNRGVTQQEFDVLMYTKVPSVLTESLYLTNEREATLLRDVSGNESSRRQQIADGHFQGILSYFGSGAGP